MNPTDKRQPARILVVEKEESVARICVKALQSDRFEVKCVTTASEGFEEQEAWRPQFYIIGDEFDDCLAIEVVGQMRGKTNAPLMVLTSTDSVGFQVNLLEAGADDVLVRPFAPPLLMAKVQSHMRRAFRYSVPPVAPRPRPVSNGSTLPNTPVASVTAVNGTNGATATATNGIVIAPRASSAPVPPEAIAPQSNFNQWPRCEACGYMGPSERFEGQDEHGRVIRCCPACSAVGRIRVPKR